MCNGLCHSEAPSGLIAPGPILLAEDEEDIVLLVRQALAQTDIPNPLVVTRDGQEAIDYLSQPFNEQHLMPALLLLDLAMPRLNGFHVLAWLRRQPHLRTVRAIVFSSSNHPDNIVAATDLGACDFVLKPRTPDAMLTFLNQLSICWLTPTPAAAH